MKIQILKPFTLLTVSIFVKQVKSKKTPRRSANSSLVCKFVQDRLFKTRVSIISIKFPSQRCITIPFTFWVKQNCYFVILLPDYIRRFPWQVLVWMAPLILKNTISKQCQTQGQNILVDLSNDTPFS